METTAICTKFIGWLILTRGRNTRMLRDSLKVAKILGCKNIISQVDEIPGIPRETKAKYCGRPKVMCSHA